MYNKVVKNNQVTYGIPFQLKVPLNFYSPKMMETAALITESQNRSPEIDFASEMIENARKESDSLICNAKEEAARIIEAAQREAEEKANAIMEEAWSTGYNEGISSAGSEYEAKMQEAMELKQEAALEHDEMIRSMEKEIIDMAMEIARKVIGEEIRVNQENMLLVARQAIEKCSNKNNMVIRVSKEDFDYLNENTDKLLSNVQGADDLEVKMDLSLKPGDCNVDTPFGSVDAGVQTKLKKIEAAFRNLIEEKIAVFG